MFRLCGVPAKSPTVPAQAACLNLSIHRGGGSVGEEPLPAKENR